MSPNYRIRQVPTAELTGTEIARLRGMLWAAFEHDESGGFSEHDWQHGLGGIHFLGELDGQIVSHAAVVERSLQIAGVPVKTGYVEAVATDPARQGRGFGTQLMRVVGDYVDSTFELGALGTGSQGFYERLGWRVWLGPSAVRTADGDEPTPDEDGYVMFRLTPSSVRIDPSAPISCEWRAGDVW